MNGRRAVMDRFSMSQWQIDFNRDLGLVRDIFQSNSKMSKKKLLYSLENHPQQVLLKRPYLRALRQRLLLIKNVMDKTRLKSAQYLVFCHETDVVNFDQIMSVLRDIATPVADKTIQRKTLPKSMWCVKKQTYRHFNYRKAEKRGVLIEKVSRLYIEKTVAAAVQHCTGKLWLEHSTSQIDSEGLFEDFPRIKTEKNRKSVRRSRTSQSRSQSRYLTTRHLNELNRLRVEMLTLENTTTSSKLQMLLQESNVKVSKSQAFIALAESRGEVPVARKIIQTKGIVTLLNQACQRAKTLRAGQRVSPWHCLKAWNDFYRKDALQLFKCRILGTRKPTT